MGTPFVYDISLSLKFSRLWFGFFPWLRASWKCVLFPFFFFLFIAIWLRDMRCSAWTEKSNVPNLHNAPWVQIHSWQCLKPLRESFKSVSSWEWIIDERRLTNCVQCSSKKCCCNRVVTGISKFLYDHVFFLCYTLLKFCVYSFIT